jgi:hypothetical protein
MSLLFPIHKNFYLQKRKGLKTLGPRRTLCHAGTQQLQMCSENPISAASAPRKITQRFLGTLTGGLPTAKKGTSVRSSLPALKVFSLPERNFCSS